MAGTHALHRGNYGPNSPFPGKCKVFLMIQHHLVANWQVRMAIGKSIIESETGLSAVEVKRAIKLLIKDKFLIVETRKLNGVFQENIYRLHPSRFGENPLYQGAGNDVKRPTFQVIMGGKFIDEKEGGGYKTVPTPSVQNCTYPSVQNCTYPKPEDRPPEPTNAEDKNLKELYKNNTQKIVESKGLSWEESKRTILADFPNDTHRLEEAYRQLKDTNLWQGKTVTHPEGFMMKGWRYMRAEFSFVDEVIRKKTETKTPEEMIDEEAAAKSRDENMKRFWASRKVRQPISS